EPLTIHGDGKNTRSYCYICDALEGTLKLLFSSQKGEAYNVGNPALEISLNDLGEAMKKLFSYPIEIKHIEPPHAVYGNSDPKRRCPDISKIQAVIDYTPRYGLNEGLSRTIDWYKEFFKTI
ncbi:MAG: nucleoside-diphosphate sugar epimerase, partial [Bacteroidia bacterium]|nr:nucleoside-diphosphate sugar epimerase [Bacteroidia bacterium]